MNYAVVEEDTTENKEKTENILFKHNMLINTKEFNPNCVTSF